MIFGLYLFALPLSIAGLNIGAGLLTLAVLRERKWPWRRSDAWPLGAVALYCLCAFAAAALAPGSFKAAAKDLHKLWILALVLASVRLWPRLRPELPLGLSFTALAVVGIIQVLMTDTGGEHWRRASAFVHPVTYGNQMALAAVGALCMLPRRWAAAFLPFGGAALFLSQTRAGLAGLAAGAFAVGAVSPRMRRWALVALAAGAGALAAWELLPSATGGRSVGDLFSPAHTAQGAVNPRSARRLLWDAALRMFRDHPVAGVGPGGYRSAFGSYIHEAMPEDVWGSAHNLYLHQLAERGLLGAVGLAAAFGVLGFVAWRRAVVRQGPWSLWAVAALAVFFVTNLTETAFQSEQVSALLLTIWALGERDEA